AAPASGPVPPRKALRRPAGEESPSLETFGLAADPCLRPEGATDNSPGRQAWVRGSTQMFEPQRGDRSAACRPVGASVVYCVVDPGLSPWAIISHPFG